MESKALIIGGLHHGQTTNCDRKTHQVKLKPGRKLTLHKLPVDSNLLSANAKFFLDQYQAARFLYSPSAIDSNRAHEMLNDFVNESVEAENVFVEALDFVKSAGSFWEEHLDATTDYGLSEIERLKGYFPEWLNVYMEAKSIPYSYLISGYADFKDKLEREMDIPRLDMITSLTMNRNVLKNGFMR